jgi:hypothetical protein
MRVEAEAERSDTDSLDGRMKVEPRGMDVDGFKRAEATMRVLITIFLVLDFALVCLFVAVGS